jgi:hypothetical protein
MGAQGSEATRDGALTPWWAVQLRNLAVVFRAQGEHAAAAELYGQATAAFSVVDNPCAPRPCRAARLVHIQIDRTRTLRR